MTITSDARRWRDAPIHRRLQLLDEATAPKREPPQIELSAMILPGGEPFDHEEARRQAKSARAMVEIEAALKEEAAAIEQQSRDAFRSTAVGRLLEERSR